MRGIILAAGRGSRMQEETRDLPKGMIELFGKSLIEHQIEKMRAVGIKEIAIVKGYKSEKINFDGVVYFDNCRWSQTNIIQSLCCAEEWLLNNDCIISYSDIIYQKDAIELLINCKENIAITYFTRWLDLWSARFENPLSDAETFELDKNGYVKVIGDRAKHLEQIKGQYMGLLKISVKGWHTIRMCLNNWSDEEIDNMDMTTLISKIIDKGVRVYGIPYDGKWLEIDSQKDLQLYKEAEEF